jgi:aminopeptidase N
MLNAQLADKSDVLGRLLAVEQMSGKKDSLGKLKDALNHDAFYGVRLAAAQSIRAIQTDEALDALIASTKQSDARVRQRVVADIAGFYREKSYTAALQIVKEEKNPDVLGRAITSLGAYPRPEVREKLIQLLNTDSYRNMIEEDAISGIRGQDDAGYIAPLLEVLQKKETSFTTTVFTRGMDTLAWLARNEEKKDAVRDFLLAKLESKKQRVQLTAISALGTLGDAKAIAALEKLTSSPKESRERAAAERAVTSLRDVRKPSAEVGGVRNEILTLQRDNRELRKEMDDLKKKLEALGTKAPDAKPAGKTAAPKFKK